MLVQAIAAFLGRSADETIYGYSLGHTGMWHEIPAHLAFICEEMGKRSNRDAVYIYPIASTYSVVVSF